MPNFSACTTRKTTAVFLFILLFFSAYDLSAFSTQPPQIRSDTWAATDALAGKVGQYPGLGPDKQVILFYWTWNERDDGGRNPFAFWNMFTFRAFLVVIL